MWPQIVSSLAAGAFLAAASVMLNSPLSLLALALVALVAWFSHSPGMTQRLSNLLTIVGMTIGLVVGVYLLLLAL
jgi:hypothetical protein